MSKSDCAHAELVKNSQQFQVGAEVLRTFHRNKKRDLASPARIKDSLITLADNEAPGFFRFRVKPRNLIERHAQTHFRHIAILDVNRDANHGDVAGLELRQEFGFNDIFAPALFVQIHRQVEMKIDNSVCVQPVDSLFDGFFC